VCAAGDRDAPIPQKADAEGLKAEYASLVTTARNGEREAMEQLLMRAQEVAYRFSLLVCGHPEDAEDVMQDALLKTYRHIKRIADPSAFRTWLYTTVRNACLTKRRRRVGEPRSFVPLEHKSDAGNTSAVLDVVDNAQPIDQQLMGDESRRHIAKLLQTLPPASRMILVMRDMEGLTTREVAEVTGYTETNVKTRLHRARLMLRRKMEEA
jgi:RNA polymerase sigma-70 factor (ECF subfamily)